MKEINRILIQLNKAVESLNSDYPQEKAIGIVLFDNLIELQLYHQTKTNLSFDRTTWYGGNRLHNSKKRYKSLAHYDNLLKFAKDAKEIEERDYEILKYVHSIRNNIYHKGELDDLKIDLAALIFYDFCNRYLIDWGSPNPLIAYTTLPGYEKINFGQGIKEEMIPEHEEYFESAINYILGKLSITGKVEETVQEILNKQLDKIERALDFIQKESKNLNYYDVLGRFWYLNSDFQKHVKQKRKPKNLDSILLLYGFLRNHQDELDDIPDLKDRQTKGKKLLKEYRSEKNGKYPHWIDLRKIRKRVEKLNDKSTDIILKNLIDIQNKIALLYTDLENASLDLDGYIMELQDLARGK